MRRIPAILLSEFPDRDDAAREAIGRCGDASTLRHVATGASFTFHFAAGTMARYLRLMPPGWRTDAEVRAELAFIDHVAAKGVPVARAVESRAAQRVEGVECSIGQCNGACVRGDRRRLVRRRVLVDGTGARSGRADGALHLAAEDLELPPGAERPSWQDEFDSLEDELPRDESELWRIIERTHALFETLQQTRDCYGMVHFDLSGDSLVWSGLSPTAVDFDDCMWHWYAGDIARTIAYFRMTDGGELGPRGGVHGGL